jgi:potassium-dependent mechanosensitive channel
VNKKILSLGLIALLVVCFIPKYGEAYLSTASILEEAKSFLTGEGAGDVKGSFDPLDLDPGWWKFFDVEGEKLDKRISAFEKYLQAVKGTLPEERVGDVDVFIRRILVNMRALPALRSKASEGYILPPVPSLKSYSLENFVEVSNILRRAKIELHDEEEELDLEKSRVKSAMRHIDNLYARYLEKKDASIDTLVAGLEIMAHRSALGVTEARLSIIALKADVDKTYIKNLEKEVDLAHENLDVRVFDKEILEKEMAQGQRAVHNAKEDISRAEAGALGTFGETPRDEAQHDLEAQNVVIAFMREAQASVQYLVAQSKYNFILSVNGFSHIDIDDLRLLVSSWKDHLVVIERQKQGWELSTRREKENAEQAYFLVNQNTERKDRVLAGMHQKRTEQALASFDMLRDLDEELFSAYIITDLLDEYVIERSSTFENWWSQALDYLSEVQGWATISLFKIGGLPLTPLSILRMVIILVAAYWFSRVTRSALQRLAEKGVGIHESTFYIFRKLIHYFILLIGILIALSSLGLDFGNLAIVAGALSVGIGFGLQKVFNNFICGLIILFERNIKVGDYVEIEPGNVGRVSDITIQNTLIHTFDGLDTIVPNAEIIGNKVVNLTLSDPFRRIHIPFYVSYGSDKEVVRTVGMEVAHKLPYTLKVPPHEPQVWLVNFGESSLDFELVIWVNAYFSPQRQTIMSACLWEIDTALKKYNITIPFPQRDLHIKSQKEPFLFDKYSAKAEDEEASLS